jgi:group I intron endonuclease
MNHFIYITTNLVNGKYYIGKRSTPTKDYDPTYLGSGNNIQAAIEKYGKENFKRDIICFTTSKKANAKLEGEIVTLETVKDPLCYNIAPGGQGGDLGPFTAEAKAKMSAAKKGKTHSPETKAKISDSIKGKKRSPRTPETREKISASLKARSEQKEFNAYDRL